MAISQQVKRSTNNKTMIINAKINVLKIPKDKLFNGEKGTYLDCKVAQRKEPDQYGNTHTIYIQKSKDDEKIYIGEGKAIEFKNDRPPSSGDSHTGVNGLGNSSNDDLPF